MSEDEDKAHFLTSVTVWSVIVTDFPFVAGRVILEHLSVTSVFVVGWRAMVPLIGQYSEAD